MSRLSFIVISLILSLKCTYSLNILAVSHIVSYSHYQLGYKMMQTLAARGHKVTLIAPYHAPEVTPGLNIVYLEGFQEAVQESMGTFNIHKLNTLSNILLPHGMALMLSEKTIAHPNVQKLLKSDEKFDVVIMEQFVSESLSAFCHKYNATCIKYSSIGTSYWTNWMLGNPQNPAYVADFSAQKLQPYGFWTRLRACAIYILERLLHHLYFMPKHDALVQQYFPGYPNVHELNYSPDILFLNSHSTMTQTVSLLPNMIEIGGYHIEPPKPLPTKYKSFMDKSKNGVIYFSLGSIMRSDFMSEELQQVLLKSLSKLPYDILWKFDKDFPNKPSNIFIDKFFPQSDLLAHPNLKLFITHGGLLSTTEAIYHGVPFIGIPLFGDQHMNLLEFEKKKVAMQLSIHNITEESFTRAINEMISNKNYLQRAKQLSKAFHDRPIKPRDAITYWVEYAVRHRGSNHFRSHALDLKWYQVYLLDVIAFSAAATIILIYIVRMVLKMLFKIICRKQKDKVKKS